jgi:Na+-driven multidrug efflux pump
MLYLKLISHRLQTGVALNVTGLYFVALPVGVLLAFKVGLGIEGIWLGMGCGALVQVASTASKCGHQPSSF